MLRCALYLAASSRPSRFLSPDSHEYISLATHFHASFLDGTHSQWFDLGLKRTPGYPSMVALIFDLFGRSAGAVVLVQIVSSLLTVWLTYRLGRRLLNPMAGALAACALALDPISVILTNYLQPETLFTLLLLGGTLAYVRAVEERSLPLAGCAGALFGLGALTRPIGLYVLIAVVPATWFVLDERDRRRVLVVVTLVLSFSAPVALWVGRNAAATGVPLVSTIEGTNLLLYRAAPALARDDGTPVAVARARLSAELTRKVGPHASAARTSHAASLLGIKTMLHHPKGSAVTAVTGMARLLGGPGRAELLRLLGNNEPRAVHSLPKRLAIGIEALVYGVIAVAAVIGALTLARARQYFPLALCLAVIGYFVVFSAGVEAFSRFRVPMMPQVCVLAGAGAMRVLGARRHGTNRPGSGPDAEAAEGLVRRP